MSKTTVLVVGATGATGKHVVQQLLDQGHTVKAVVRSEEKMKNLLKQENYQDRLQLTEASLLDLTDDQLQELVKDCHAVVSCLGHTMDAKGLWGNPKRLVADATKRLTSAMSAASTSASKKYILMSSVGVTNPNGKDDPRTALEKGIIFLVRHLINPHKDNEEAAAYLYHDIGSSSSSSETGLEWTVLRPDDLIDGDVSKYEIMEKPKSGLFGSNVSTRANVASAMVELVLNNNLWNKWKFQMPVVCDIAEEPPTTTTTTDETTTE